MENQLDNDGIISRIRYLLEHSPASLTQAEMARRIGMDPSNFSKHLSGKLPVSRALVNRIVVDLGISKNWLENGEGMPFEKRTTPKVEEYGEVHLWNHPHRGIPVYDIDVTAGCRPLERMLTDDHVKGYVDLPRLNRDAILVRVTGDSMEPRIMDGGFIAIRPVKSSSSIFWGQTYLVVMPDYRMVKVLRRHPTDPSMVILHSENPLYDDMDVNREEIEALFLVETVLNIKNLC
ncbi:MAG: helix-turn-helix transcriptional regulator [Bacteroidales bacterium]|nr:helix-turn-helix transcriptional regulator [Bacteroidales bacterium]MBD5235447.1 helix-turn-helix transcriptional regulator [Barnesiella sp.]MBD5246829.1 helix-turn-helix transcriptional regulator [Barnesiella sp.]MBD5258091.1 helix-turn-helix transcriptional regulator [Barnesiella sp.]